MSSGEWWSLWWSRFHEKLNPLVTWMALVTFYFAGVVALLIMVGLAEKWLIWGSIVLVCIPIICTLILGWLAYPPALNSKEATGRKLTLLEIQKLPPKCVKVAFVGVGSVGKTTLLEYLTALPESHAETVSPEMAIFPVASPVNLLVYLAAAGQDLTQQFEIMDHADFLVLLLDHNPKAVVKISNKRLTQQERNIDQLVRKIRRLQNAGNHLSAIHVLRNKQDLWSQNTTVQQEYLLKCFENLISKLHGVMPESTVTDANHSNALAPDIASVRAKIMQLAQRVVQLRQPP